MQFEEEKNHTPIYSLFVFRLKRRFDSLIHQSASSLFLCWCAGLLPLDTWDINIILGNNQQTK